MRAFLPRQSLRENQACGESNRARHMVRARFKALGGGKRNYISAVLLCHAAVAERSESIKQAFTAIKHTEPLGPIDLMRGENEIIAVKYIYIGCDMRHVLRGIDCRSGACLTPYRRVRAHP